MKKIPTITINNPNRIINTNVPNTGGGSGNQFTNWTPPTGNFGGNTGNTNIPTFNPPSMNVPSNIPIVNSGDKYGLHNIKELPRVANENEFAATCHGGIAVDSIIDHAITRNSQGYGPNALASLKTFNLSHNYLGDEEIKKLNAGLYGYTLNLQVFNFCNNNMGAVGLDHLIKGSIGIDHLQKGGNDLHNMMQGILTLPSTSIVCLNLANNNIGDIGADILGHALANGKLPATKNIDVSGNNITGSGVERLADAITHEGAKNLRYLDVSSSEVLARLDRAHSGTDKMLQGIKNAKGHIAVVIAKIQSGFSTTGKLVFGSKEEKQGVIKETLQTAQDNGVDVKNVAVSKNISEGLINSGKVLFSFSYGFTKCNIVPESVGTFAADQIIAKISKKAFTVSAATDATLCFFSTIEEVATSHEGVQFIKDVDLFGATVLIDGVE